MMKYIMTEAGPIIFPQSIEHGNVAHAFGMEVFSAGFVSQDEINGMYVHGQSVSLVLKANEKDLDKIKRALKP